jgi:hypothetical protein
MIRVWPKDIRAAKICFQGARPWFRRHGLDWQAFVRTGIEAGRLEATGDALALRVTAEARRRIAAETTAGPRDGR